MRRMDPEFCPSSRRVRLVKDGFVIFAKRRFAGVLYVGWHRVSIEEWQRVCKDAAVLEVAK